MNARQRKPSKDKPQGASTRWQRRKGDRPAEILAAALAVFGERGFAAARLDEVAARAGVSKGTLYLYFDSKAELFKAVVRATLLPNIAQAEAAASASEGPSAALLRTILQRMATLVVETDIGAVLKLVIAEAGNFPDLAAFYYNEVIARGLKLFGGILSRGIARGEFRPVDVDDAVRLLLAPMLLAVVWRRSFAEPSGAPFDMQKFIALHLETLLRGLSPAPGGNAS